MIRTFWQLLFGSPPEAFSIDRSPRGPGERVMCLDCEATYDCRRNRCPVCASGTAMASDLAGAR